MDLELTGKTALITDVSRGIGFGVTRALAGEGCNLHLVSRIGEDLGDAAQRLGAGFDVGVEVHCLDLTDSSNINVLLDTVATPDILINNAGTIPGGDLQSVDEPIRRTAWDLKVFGYINLSRAIYAGMQRRGSGVIINVTGLAADRIDVNYMAGSASDASTNAFTRALGSVSLEHGIRVLAVSPGSTETERLVGLMKTQARADLNDEDRWRELLAGLPMARAASVEEVADVVVFMASNRASYVSGIVVNVDGGLGSRAGSFSR